MKDSETQNELDPETGGTPETNDGKGSSEKTSPEQPSADELNRYLTDLVHMQDRKLLMPGDLKALNEKYSLGREDLEKLEMLIDRHLDRADEYRVKERWDNAIVETERALLFAPLNNSIRLDLAELYLNRSARYGYMQKDLQRSERQLKDALILEPDSREAKRFQRELKNLQDMLRGKEKKRLWVPLLLLLTLLMGAVLYPRIRESFHFRSLEEAEVDQAAAKPEWTSRELSWQTRGVLGEDFSLNLADVTLRKEDETGLPSLSLSGSLLSLKGSYETLDVELFFDKKSVATLSLIPDGAAPLREGETAVFSASLRPEGDPESEEPLTLVLREKKALIEEEPPRWEPLKPFAASPLPEGLFLGMEGRIDSMIEGYDRSYLFYDLRIENRGLEDIGALELDLQWCDGHKNILSSRRLSLVEDPLLPLRENEVRTSRVMFSLSKEESAAEGTGLEIVLIEADKE